MDQPQEKITKSLLGVRVATDLLEDDLIETLEEIKALVEEEHSSQMHSDTRAVDLLSRLIEELKAEK
jgi:hypothetical protein